MKLTKYQHACFTVEEDDKILVVDPGEFSTNFLSPENVVGIVITHQHGDHFDTERLAEIMDKNSEARRRFWGGQSVQAHHAHTDVCCRIRRRRFIPDR